MMAPMFSGLLSLLLMWTASAEFNLAPGLQEADRKLVLKTLGLGTLSKNLSGQPLGTESGLELSISTELIDTDKIKSLITDHRSQDTLYYPKITIGKGIYERTDIFFHFIPYTATLGVSEFGAILRYNIYRSDYTPLLVSMIVHANSANFNNQFSCRNVGTDLMFAMGWPTFSVFGTVGVASSSGNFTGGTQGITASLLDEKERVGTAHVGIGALARFGVFTTALSFDHYIDPVYTIKLGLLF